MIPLLDLSRTHDPIADEIEATLNRVFRSGRYILGPEVEAFEDLMAEYLGVAHAIGVSNGTDALVAALQALRLPVGAEVITSPFTFVATGDALVRAGLKPVFVDVEADTLLMDPELQEQAITDRTGAILPVHLFGQCADMDRIRNLAQAHGLKIVEDTAQAVGAAWRGTKAGGLGDLGAFSFFPSKNLGALGDGGLVTTNDPELAERTRRIRVHCASKKYHHDGIGGNYRLDALQAAVLSVKLPHLDRWNEQRRAAADRYDELFEDAGLMYSVGLRPLFRLPDSTHVFHQYTIRCPDRTGLQRRLAAAGIGCATYYPVPLHLQPCFADLGYGPGSLPEAEAAAEQALSIPIFPGLTEAEQAQVVQTIVDHYEETTR